MAAQAEYRDCDADQSGDDPVGDECEAKFGVQHCRYGGHAEVHDGAGGEYADG